ILSRARMLSRFLIRRAELASGTATSTLIPWWKNSLPRSTLTTALFEFRSFTTTRSRKLIGSLRFSRKFFIS
ncbi:hypothetical protein C0991_001347, partial [Blastosporella zonata]